MKFPASVEREAEASVPSRRLKPDQRERAASVRRDGPGVVVDRRDPTAPAKKQYSSPHLVSYGDVRDLTLGPSPGVGESGNPAVFRA